MFVSLVYLCKEPALVFIDLLYCFLDSISFISVLIFIMSFLILIYLCALFILLFQVPLHVKLDCLFELLLVYWVSPVMLWIFLLGLLSRCPEDFGLLCPVFHVFQGIFWFLPWSHFCPIHCLITCYVASMSLCVFSVFFLWLI